MNWKNWFKNYVLIVGFFILGNGIAYGQCDSCTITFNGNGNPSPNRNIQNNDIICVIANRTTQINLRNANDLTICIATGVTYNNTFSNINGNNVVINNYGQIGTNANRRAITLGNNGVFNNFGSYFGNFTSNGGSDITNSGSIVGNITLNSTGAIFQNSGTQTGSLSINNNTVINSGLLELSGLTIGSGSPGLTNTSTGTINLDQGSDLSINGPFNTAGTFRFLDDDENVSIQSSATVINTGLFIVARDLTVNGTFISTAGRLTVGRNLTNNSSGSLQLGNTTVEEDFTNNGLTTLAGELFVGDDLTNNSNGLIRPANTDQCNTVFVTDDFENNNSTGITGNNLTGNFQAPLIVNKAPSRNGVSGGAKVDPNLDCSCGRDFSSSGEFIVPEGVTSITMKAWGAGGKGGDRSGNSGRSGGGGAGAYSESVITVTPGETLYFQVGQGSASTVAGRDSWVSRSEDGSNPIFRAKGGNSATTNSTSGAQGGQANQGIGTIRISGENGQNAGDDGGDGGDSPNGGQGGQGGSGNNTNGNPGESPGGGGGGARTQGNGNNRSGGDGGDGQISFSFDCPITTNPPNSGCWRYIDDGSVSGTVIIEFFQDCEWDAPENLTEFEVLVVGGGGGGGVRSGGGGGGGGLVHARVDVTKISETGLPAGKTFEIEIGEGGQGAQNRNTAGGNGEQSTFDFGNSYQIIAGGGGGGGSDDNNSGRPNRRGQSGAASSINSGTQGLSVVSSRMFGGSGGGAGHGSDNPGNGNGNGRNGGRADDHAGGGGGGAGSNGREAPDDDEGGDGGAGLVITEFDSRIYSAGGGGGSREDDPSDRGFGGTNLRGGNGGYDEDGQAVAGENGRSPGSGGGGGGHSESAFGGNGAKGVVIVRYEIARILPIELLGFDVAYDQQNRQSNLSWSTAKEWNNSHFEIQRSVNDVKNWETIAEVNGAGYSDQILNYSFVDKNLPASGGNVFYRINQVDYDGKTSLSKTRAVRVERLNSANSWVAYPNPSASGTEIAIELSVIENYSDEGILVQVSDVRGVSRSYSVSKPSDVALVVNSHLGNSETGVYLVQIIWGNQSHQLKILRN
jgi:hypothetical protein